jgi:hypothetical protein
MAAQPITVEPERNAMRRSVELENIRAIRLGWDNLLDGANRVCDEHQLPRPE